MDASLTAALERIHRAAAAPGDEDGAPSLPWADPAFSARFAERVDYEALFGHPAPAQQVDALERQLALAPGATVLDLCSGPGAHAIELARRGHHVLAVDVGPGATALGRRRAQAAGVTVDFHTGDVLDRACLSAAVAAASDGGADAAFVIRGQIDNFAPRDLERLADNLAAWLRPGGTVALEFTPPGMAPKATARSWYVSEARTSIWADHTCLVLTDRRWDGGQAAAIARFFVLHPDGRLDRYRSTTYTHARRAVASLLRAKGFTRVRFEPGDARWTRLLATRAG